MRELRIRLSSLLSRLGGWPRRVAALACLVLAAISALAPNQRSKPAPLRRIWVAAQPLAAGAVLTAADLSSAYWPANLVPPSAVPADREILGRPIGAPMARGEPVTTNRLLDTSLTASLRPGQVAAAITLPDHGERALLPVGSLIDVYATPGQSTVASGPTINGATSTGRPARPIAENVRVVAILPVPQTGHEEMTVVVAVTRDIASRLADRVSDTLIATLVRPP